MQLISELEEFRRGPYGGAVLYSLPDGTMDACIALRTMVMADGVAYLQAGAGVVADSDPDAEHEECLKKLAALEAAIDLAEGEFASMKVLMIDNYDSFTYNLVHLFEELGAEVVTVRNDAITVDEARAGGFDRLVVSPGPGRPDERRRLDRADPRARRRPCRRSASASGTRRSSRRSAARSARRRRCCTARRARSRTTASASTRASRQTIEVGRYHSLAATRRARRRSTSPRTPRTAR